MFPRRSSDDEEDIPFRGRESTGGPPPTLSSRPSIHDCVPEANRQSHSSFTRDFFTTRPPSVLDELGSTSTADHVMDRGGAGAGGDGSSGVPVVVGDGRYANDSFRSHLSAGTRSTTSHFRYEDRIIENINNNNNNNNDNNDDDDDDDDSIGDKELEDEDDTEQRLVPPYSESTLDYTSTSSLPPSPPSPPPPSRPANAYTTRQRWNRDVNDEDDAEGGRGDGGVEMEQMENESDGDDGASPWSNWKKMLKLKTNELGGSNGSGSGSGVGVGTAGGSSSGGGSSTRKKHSATHSSVISPRENEVDSRGGGGGGDNVMTDIESARERRGECPGCGQRCFALDEMGGGLNGHGSNNAEKRPLTVPGRVLNGDCLRCNPWLADVEREVRTPQQQQTWNQDSARRGRREKEECEEDVINNRSTTVSSRSKPGAVAVSSPPDAIEKDEDGRSSSSYIADDDNENDDDEHVAPPITRTTRRSSSGNGDSMDQRAQRRLRELLDVLTVHNIPSSAPATVSGAGGGGGDALPYNNSKRQSSGRLHESFTEGMGNQYHRNHAEQGGGGGWGGEAGNAAFVDPLRYRRRSSLTDGTVSSTTSSLSPRSPIGRNLGSRAQGSVGPKPREGRPTPAPGPVEPDHPGPRVSQRFLVQEKLRSRGRKNQQRQQQMKCVPELCPGTVIVPNTVDDENGAAEIVLPIDEHIVLCKECRTKLCVKKFATLVSCPECETVSAASSTRR